MGELLGALLNGHDDMKMRKIREIHIAILIHRETGVILKFVAKGEDLKLSGAILQFIPGFEQVRVLQ